MAVATIGQNSGDTYSGQTGAALVQPLPTTNFSGQSTYEPESTAANVQNCVLRFPGISSLPAGATITAASLNLYEQSANGTSTASIYQIIRSGIVLAQETWNVYATASNWGTAGCENTVSDRSATTAGDVALALADGAGYRSFTNAAFLTLVQGWYSGGVNNFGVLLKISAGVSKSGIFTGDAGANGQRPYLSITYTPAAVKAFRQYYERLLRVY